MSNENAISKAVTPDFTLAQLAQIEAIKQLMADYWWGIDTKDWKAWRDVFTDDVQFIMDGKVQISGADMMVAGIQHQLDGITTAHQGHQNKIEITGQNTAKGRWILNDVLVASDGALVQRGYGYYLDEYEKGNDGKWRIKSLTLCYFHVQR
jgi:ketosteroid isomerase-like protein